MRPDKSTILAQARASQIPAGLAGLWSVVKFSLSGPFPVKRGSDKEVILPAGHYTQLWCQTEATMHLPYGVLVMQDTPEELATHLDFMLRANGRVLITGLGLGCVLRGCLANPNVESCTVVERDPHVLNLVAPHLPRDRFEIVKADATAYVADMPANTFDCAWHDLWNDPARDEDHLQVIHSGLICACTGKIAMQGAWAFPHYLKRVWRRATNLI
jgi:hypothetical protein